MPRDTLDSLSDQPVPPVPFGGPADAWFWFMQCHMAREDGARIGKGRGGVPRPCEPIDVIRVIDRLFRQRRLLRDHICVLAHYGRRLLPPDPTRPREQRAYGLWIEALERIDPVMRRKGIVV